MRSVVHTNKAVAQVAKMPACLVRMLALASMFVALQGCSMTGKALESSTADVMAMTAAPSTVAPDPFTDVDDTEGAERDRLLDEDTIRSAVTSANLEETSEALAWANEATGSSGEIRGISQRKVSGQTCRSFSATREAYDGVTLYRGELCLDRRTGWWTRSLAPANAADKA